MTPRVTRWVCGLACLMNGFLVLSYPAGGVAGVAAVAGAISALGFLSACGGD